MFNEDLLLVCKALWRRKDEVKQYIDNNNEDAVIGCIAKEIEKIELEDPEEEEIRTYYPTGEIESVFINTKN